mmetsp:Transcript_10919/g.28631  ORF Transcript_10919/g.28631 Transcript_10919/m.28631 type:complete len:460 (+) Transcript_10919:1348-2727(+)
MLLDKGVVLRIDFLLQLLDLMIHNLELAPHLVDFILMLDQVLAVQVSIGSHSLVQVLLLLQPLLALCDLFLQVHDGHITDLYLLHRLQVLGSGLRCFSSVLLSLLLEGINHLSLLLCFLLVAGNLLLKGFAGILVNLDQIKLLLSHVVSLSQVVVEEILLSGKILHLLFLRFDLFAKGLHLSFESRDFLPGHVPLLFNVEFLVLHNFDLVKELVSNFVLLRDLRFELSGFICFHLDLHVFLLALGNKTGILMNLLFQLHIELLRLLCKRIILFLDFLNFSLPLLQLSLQPSNLLSPLIHKGLLLADFSRFVFHPFLHLLQLLVEKLLSASLALSLSSFGGDHILEGMDFVLSCKFLLLKLTHPFLVLDDLIAKGNNLGLLGFTILQQLLLHFRQLLHCAFLANGETCTFFHQPAQVLNFQLELLNCLFCLGFTLLSGVNHLPRFLQFLPEVANESLVLL